MNILKTHRKIVDLLEVTGRGKGKTPSIEQMAMVLLIYRKKATSAAEIAEVMKKSVPSVRSMGYKLSDGKTTSFDSAYGFIELIPSSKVMLIDPAVRYRLTPDGKKFARIIAKSFGD